MVSKNTNVLVQGKFPFLQYKITWMGFFYFFTLPTLCKSERSWRYVMISNGVMIVIVQHQCGGQLWMSKSLVPAVISSKGPFFGLKRTKRTDSEGVTSHTNFDQPGLGHCTVVEYGLTGLTTFLIRRRPMLRNGLRKS